MKQFFIVQKEFERETLVTGLTDMLNECTAKGLKTPIGDSIES